MKAETTADILALIEDGSLTRKDIAIAYAELILWASGRSDWRAINDAIVTRWSVAGLDYIKQQAWNRLGAMARGE